MCCMKQLTLLCRYSAHCVEFQSSLSNGTWCLAIAEASWFMSICCCSGSTFFIPGWFFDFERAHRAAMKSTAFFPVVVYRAVLVAVPAVAFWHLFKTVYHLPYHQIRRPLFLVVAVWCWLPVSLPVVRRAFACSRQLCWLCSALCCFCRSIFAFATGLRYRSSYLFSGIHPLFSASFR